VKRKKRKLIVRKVLPLVAIVISTVLGVLIWSGGILGRSGAVSASPPAVQSSASTWTGSSQVFTPAHSSIGEAIRHFLALRDGSPEQPIPYSHQLHVGEVGLRCAFCHDGVSVGPVAGIPGVETCMLCHSEVVRDRPAIEMLAEYYDQGLEPPWQRVYGWMEEAHVRFNHRPHFNAGVGCETCHGNVSLMDVAERAVDHTMGFCIACHEQEDASNECTSCHF